MAGSSCVARSRSSSRLARSRLARSPHGCTQPKLPTPNVTVYHGTVVDVTTKRKYNFIYDRARTTVQLYMQYAYTAVWYNRPASAGVRVRVVH